ncbi:cell division control protein 16 [Pisolithus marmoratus]|nr:cell division control protein 16 [Pisolithus marmoratus]
MASTPPPAGTFVVPPVPRLPSTARNRSSVGSSFSLGPQGMVSSFTGDTSNASLPHAFALDPNRSLLHSSPRSSPRRHRRAQDSTSRHPLANHTVDVFQDSELAGESEDGEWGMVDRMRLWRHDALMQHLYETASFWGDKILSWTSDPNDAFWLAQTYFMIHQYSRAERLLTRPFPVVVPNGKGKEIEAQAGSMPRLPMGPAGLVKLPEELHPSVSRLVDMSVACRYLAAQCQVRQGNWSDALEMLGEANPFRHSERSGAAVPNVDGGIKVEASMCHLRGILMLKLNRGEQAKLCFMEALTLDVKCYDAFSQLIGGEMMTPDEEWEFVQGLAYKQQAPDDADFIQLMYTSHLRKYRHEEEHALTRQRLVEDYRLSDNPDVLSSFADALYTQRRWADCYVITTRILELVTFHDATLPLHIACMYHLSHLRSKLFVLAHELVDKEPENPISWYAVGVWYLSADKWSQARQYFSKTSLMDPRFAPAWIAFAHTFAMEREHDHAVTAYSTCARMFLGSHLPLLFIGMEQIMLSNHQLADEALHAAHAVCDSDPLLINELGVMAFTHGDYQEAVQLFERSLELAQVTQSSERSWTATYLNLGTCFRKLKAYEKAKENYQRVLEIEPQHRQGLGFLGMVYHFQDEVDKAIVKYHEALSVDPINNHIIELLNLALESNIACGSWEKVYPGGEEAFRGMMASLKSKFTKKGDEARLGDGNRSEEAMNVG